jgi:phospholipase C
MANMKRRDALKTIGGLAGMAGLTKLLPGCGDDGGNNRPPGISTIVYLMLENRSYDHALGARNLEGLPGDGISNAKPMPDINGTMVAPFEAPDDRGASSPSLCDPDPPHGWDASHAQFNAGAMDGFVTEHQQDHGNNAALTEPMKYMTRTHQPITWALADAYTVCDRWFCSVMGPTLPNRAYWMAGTSFGLQVNTDVLTKFGSGVPIPTIFNRLDEAGVDWCYYFGSIAVVAALGNPGPYQLDLGPNDGTGRIRRFGDAKVAGGQFFKDAAAGTLPSVVYIDPAYGFNDDHPPVHPILGQELIASVYTALANSPQWENCLLVVTYDENGGYADHVAPPTTTDDTEAAFGVPGFEQLGFRVPTIVAGPYVKQSYVSSVQYDHTSGLKHLQNHFGLEGLTARMAAANDLMDCIDLDRLARFDPAPPIELPVIDSNDYPFDANACRGASDFKPKGFADDPITAYADKHPEAFTGYADARDEVPEYIQGIRNYLHRHGVRR